MPTTDRRALIVDTAIDLIAVQGIRALTHRALDAELAYPTGSVSYYFRTKRDLIEAITDRIATRSRDDFTAAQLTGGAPVNPEATADAIATWLDQLLAQRRNHLIARHVLILELLSEPEPHAQLVHSLFSTERARDLFHALGFAAPAPAAANFIAIVEGAVFDRFAGARTNLPPGTPESIAQLSTLLVPALKLTPPT